MGAQAQNLTFLVSFGVIVRFETSEKLLSWIQMGVFAWGKLMEGWCLPVVLCSMRKVQHQRTNRKSILLQILGCS